MKKNIETVLGEIINGLISIFHEKLIGVYLFGSLTYGDFKPGRSDIDFLTILKTAATSEEIRKVHKLHVKIESEFPEWKKRIENSLTPVNFLKNTLPPKELRPYYGEGAMYEKAKYGNEWIINLYLTRKYGKTLYGQDFKTLVGPISVEKVRKANIRDLLQEWAPKANDPQYLKNDHNQSYVILNICRILYTISNGEPASKTISAKWAKERYKGKWKTLIETAENWEYGDEMKEKKKTAEFIRFAVSEINTFKRSGT